MGAIDTTIVVPMYNVEGYLPDFFVSLAEQTYQGFRLVLVDDASTDSTYEVARCLAEPFGARALLLRNGENLGLSGARNRGLSAAHENSTEYVTFLDPDDFVEPGYIDDLHGCAIATGADLTVSGIVRFDDGSGDVLCTEMVSYPDDVLVDASSCDDLAFINPCSYAKLYRFEGIRDLRFRDVKRSEDTCYLFEALPALPKIAFTNNAFYHYRVRPSSLSGTFGRDRLDSMHEVFAELLPQFDLPRWRPFREMFECQVFIRSSVGGVTRLAFQDMGQAGRISAEELAWLDASMPSWRENRYLSFGGWRAKTPKQEALKAAAQLYKAHAFPAFIRLYWFVSNVLKKEVRA